MTQNLQDPSAPAPSQKKVIISLLGFANASPEYQDLARSLVLNKNLADAELWAFESDRAALEGNPISFQSKPKYFNRPSDLISTLQLIQKSQPTILNPMGSTPIKSFALPTVCFILPHRVPNLWSPLQVFGAAPIWESFCDLCLSSTLIVYCPRHVSYETPELSKFRDFVENFELKESHRIIEYGGLLSEAASPRIQEWCAKGELVANHFASELAPLVSVITPSFNHAPFIEQTIQSVLGQSYPNFEYIVVDGGSKDGTLDILRSYGSQVAWTSEPDRGYADAVRKGFQRARGKYLCWVPSDDEFFDSGSLSLLVSAIERSKADVVFGNCLYVDETSRWLDQYRTSSFDINRLRNWCLIPQPSTLFSAAAYRKVDGIRDDLISVADYDLWLRIAESGGRFLRIGPIVSKYRLHSASITTSQSGLTYAEIIRMQRTRYGNVSPGWINGAIGEIVHQLKGRPRIHSFGQSYPSSPNRFRTFVRSRVIEPLVRRVPLFQNLIAVLLHKLGNS